jgi:hypothetical protein
LSAWKAIGCNRPRSKILDNGTHHRTGGCFELTAAAMQDRLGVAVGLFGARQDQFSGGLEGDAVLGAGAIGR